MPVPKVVLTFAEAMTAIFDGKLVSKMEWNDPDIFGCLKDGILMLHKPDGKFYQWIINDGDLAGEDFFVIE